MFRRVPVTTQRVLAFFYVILKKWGNMTLAQAIDMTLRRVGLSPDTGTFEDQARRYLNVTAIEIANLTDWWWLDRTTTFTTVDGTRTYTPISSDVTAWYSFVDETNNTSIIIVGPDDYDMLDLDRSEEGNLEAVFIAGMDATTGYPVIECYPTPSTTGDTIRIRYRIAISSWSSSNDTSTLMALGIPQILESALVYGAAALYLEEKGDLETSARERQNLDNTVMLAKKANLRMQGNRLYKADPPHVYGDLVLHYGTTAAVP